MSFTDDLASLINRYSLENKSDTPDFILAQYLVRCLDAFNEATSRREEWYRRELPGCAEKTSGCALAAPPSGCAIEKGNF